MLNLPILFLSTFAMAAEPPAVVQPTNLSSTLLTQENATALSKVFTAALALPSASDFSYLDPTVQQGQAWILTGGTLGQDTISIAVLGSGMGGVSLGLLHGTSASFFSWKGPEDMCMMGNGDADIAYKDINRDGKIDIVAVMSMSSCGPGGGDNTFNKALVVMSNPNGWTADYKRSNKLSQKVLSGGANLAATILY